MAQRDDNFDHYGSYDPFGAAGDVFGVTATTTATAHATATAEATVSGGSMYAQVTYDAPSSGSGIVYSSTSGGGGGGVQGDAVVVHDTSSTAPVVAASPVAAAAATAGAAAGASSSAAAVPSSGASSLFPLPPRATPTTAHLPAVTLPSFEIFVDDPQKHGGPLKAYVSYRINTKTTMEGYRSGAVVARRRFNEFDWLREVLQTRFVGYLIPPLPAKKIKFDQFDPEFIEERRRGLERFLRRVTSHPVLHASQELKVFLSSSDEELSATINATKKRFTPSQLLADVRTFFGRSEVSNDLRIDVAFSRGVEWERKLSYLAQLARESAGGRRELAGNLSRMAVALVAASEKECTSVRMGLQVLASAVQRGAEAQSTMGTHDAGPLHDALSDLAAQGSSEIDMLRTRQALMAEYVKAANELESNRQKLAKMSSKSDSRTSSMEATVAQCEQHAVTLKQELNDVTERCVAETARFHTEKFETMRSAVLLMVQSYIEQMREELSAFQALVPTLENMQFDLDHYSQSM